MRTWIKLYTEILRDPKMGRLTDRQYRTCIDCFLLAGTIDEDGLLGVLDDVAWHLRRDIDAIADDLVVLADLGIVAQDGDGTWCVRQFETRQARAPSADRTAVSERVKKHRAAKRECNEHVTTLQHAVTPSDSDTEIDTETEADTESGETPDTPAPATFTEWAGLLQASTNRPADLVRMFAILYPNADTPTFGYIGKVARQVGGAGRLAELLWQNHTRPPTGDVLAYCLAVHKGGNARASPKPTEPAGFAGIREWLRKEQHGEQGDRSEGVDHLVGSLPAI
jgi:hypothetical protein